MSMSLGLAFHIMAGAIGLGSGTVAVLSRKGGPRHLVAGRTYILSMGVMGLSGLLLALKLPVWITVLAGALTLYLVGSSLLTVRRFSSSMQGFLETVMLLGGLAVLSLGLFLSWRAYNGITDNLGDFVVPPAVYFVFTAVAMLAVALDMSLWFRGQPRDKHRILRHLWRMFVPLYIAASSFFTGQQQVFPETLQGTIYLSLPENAVLILLMFWLGKVAISWRAAPTRFLA